MQKPLCVKKTPTVFLSVTQGKLYLVQDSLTLYVLYDLMGAL